MSNKQLIGKIVSVKMHGSREHVIGKLLLLEKSLHGSFGNAVLESANGSKMILRGDNIISISTVKTTNFVFNEIVLAV